MAKLVANTYGEALFSLAVEENRVDDFYAEVKSIREILAANPEFDTLMNHPKITKEEKEKVISDVFSGRTSDEMTGFMKLLLRKERYGDIAGILDFFSAKVKEYKNIGVAYVTTAEALKDTQKASIQKKLLETTGCKEMEMHYSVDESLIGGVVIRIGDRVVDSSIKTKLEELKKELSDLQVG